MTKHGQYLAQKSVNKLEAARKTGLIKGRMNELTLHERSHLRAEELYLIALSLDINPSELMESIYNGLKLKKQKLRVK